MRVFSLHFAEGRYVASLCSRQKTFGCRCSVTYF
jgi:hypothetical protein